MILEKCKSPAFFNGTIVGCGKCISCKNFKRNEWSIRLEHELIENGGFGVFVTLTYNNENLLVTGKEPISLGDEMGTLNKRDVQLFLKRLRKKIEPKKIKYIIAGEYGTAFKRPHYHCLIMGIDKNYLSQNDWEMCWGKGKVDVDPRPLGNGCINYIHSYIKKESFLTKADKIKFELKYNRVAPFIMQSQGIGKKWAINNVAGWSKSMLIRNNGHKVSVPRYYIKVIKKLEGKTIKTPTKVTTIYKNEVITNKYTYYQVIENPNAKYTKIINEICKKRFLEQIEELKNNKIKLNNVNKLIEEFIKKDELKQIKYNNYKKMLDNKRFKVKIAKKPKTIEQNEIRNLKTMVKMFGENIKVLLSRGKQKNYELELKIESIKKPYSKIEKLKYIQNKKNRLDKIEKSSYIYSNINIEDIGGIKKYEYC